MKKMIELNLPEFAFLEGYGEADELYGRYVILHVRSASVMEIFSEGDVFFNEDVLTMPFKRLNFFLESMTGRECEEKYIMLLHHSPLLDILADKEMIIKEIMKPASMWFNDYCTFMDNSIREEDVL